MAYKSNILLKLTNFVDGVITFAKLQNIATAKLLGRTSASSGVIEELDITNYQNQLIPLVTTFADCENTTSEIDIATVTIPANTLADGDLIKIVINSVVFNNSGSNFTLGQKITINANTIVNPSANAITSGTNFRYIRHELTFYALNVSGDNIDLVQNNIFSGTTGLVSPIGLTFPTTSTTYTAGVRHTPATVNKTAINTIYVKLKWSGANANTYVRNYQAQAYIIKKAV